MTKYGFVIDHRKCIGCHACTVACKSENQVPLGVFRTWVKYIEKGAFPNTRRYFSVERCQHCEDAPCVEICPTKALFKRHDGIVDFESDRCIGCKSCMQACPYDALYIDPRSHTAAKCHYCAHRTDRGLLPACVIVCPTKAIVAGDLQDAGSEIAQMVAREQVQVRRPDQGTRPQVYYVGADETAITPGLAAQPARYMWSQVGPTEIDLEPKGSLFQLAGGAGQGTDGKERGDGSPVLGSSKPSPAGWAPVAFSPQGVSGTRAVTVYDVGHPKPWGWKVAAYLWTKSLGAGALIVAGLLVALGLGSTQLAVGAGIIATVFTALTTGLLVWDLKRPERFWRVVFTPNPRSWLVWGAYILIAYSLVALAWIVLPLLGEGVVPIAIAWAIVGLGILLGAAAAGYSAFLFGQAEGRDFWQSPILLWQLLGAAIVGGSASLLLLTSWFEVSSAPIVRLALVLGAGIVFTAGTVAAELYTPHPNKDAASAAALLKRGPLAGRFWGGYGLVGVAIPLVLLVSTLAFGLPLWLSPLAALLALVGLWLYEDVWIKAGQSVAMS